MNQDERQAKARRQLLWMFGISFAALGIAYVLFLYAQGGGGWGTTNNGDFVVPPTHVDDLAIEGFDTGGKWWLWAVTDDCDASCVETLEGLKSLHILLNRNADRVSRGLLTNGLVPVEDEHLSRFARPQVLRDGVYIVDPHGNVVLRYAIDTPPKPVLEDLKRLLKLSQIG